VNAASINTVTASTGPHTLHVKSWGNQGSACDTDVAIIVSASAVPAWFTDVTVSRPNPGAELVSPFALVASGGQCESQPIVAFGFSIDNSGSTTIVTSTSINAPVSSALGAHTLHVKSWGNQGAGCVTNIAIKVVPSPVSQLPSSAIAVESIQALTGCNVQNWTQNAWHDVQITCSRDGSGNVTCRSVWLDNVKQNLNGTVPDAFALGWGRHCGPISRSTEAHSPSQLRPYTSIS
jgi:hypothetical protein